VSAEQADIPAGLVELARGADCLESLREQAQWQTGMWTILKLLYARSERLHGLHVALGTGLAAREQWERLDDTVDGLRAMLDDARSMRRRDVAILSDAFGFCRELLLRRPAEYGGPRECR
jgi:hypothetical protein